MKRLPSGNYNTQIRIDGKVVSVTAPTVAGVKKRVAELRCSVKHTDAHKINFKDAMDKLLANKSNVLSANTMKGYKTIAKTFVYFYGMDVNDITQMDVQYYVNEHSKIHSPHSVINAYSFLMTVIKSVRKVDFQIKLPQKKRTDIPFPSMDEINLMLENAEPNLRNAIRLAVFGPLRRGEICALKYGDVSGNVIHVHATITQDGGYAYKDTPKSIAGDRYISFPKEMIKDLGKGDKDDYIIGMTPEALYMKYRRLLKRIGLPHYSFHTLRRASASWLHSMGKSNAYIMKRGGWETESCLISIYRKNTQDDDDVLNEIKTLIKTP